MRQRTWKVLRWDNEPEIKYDLELACNQCGYDAHMPVGDHGGLLIAAIGLGLVFDPPGHIPPANFMPTEIQCRKCRTIWEGGYGHVR